MYRTKNSSPKIGGKTLSEIYNEESSNAFIKKRAPLFILLYSDSTNNEPHFSNEVLGAINNQLTGMLKLNKLNFIEVRQYKNYNDLKNTLENLKRHINNIQNVIFCLTNKPELFISTVGDNLFESFDVDYWGNTTNHSGGDFIHNGVLLEHSGGHVFLSNIYDPRIGITDTKPIKKQNLGNYITDLEQYINDWSDENYTAGWINYVQDWSDTAWAILHEVSAHAFGFIIEKIFNKVGEVDENFEKNTWDHPNSSTIENAGIKEFTIEIVKSKKINPNKECNKVALGRFNNFVALSNFINSSIFRYKYYQLNFDAMPHYYKNWYELPDNDNRKLFSKFVNLYFHQCEFYKYR